MKTTFNSNIKHTRPRESWTISLLFFPDWTYGRVDLHKKSTRPPTLLAHSPPPSAVHFSPRFQSFMNSKQHLECKWSFHLPQRPHFVERCHRGRCFSPRKFLFQKFQQMKSVEMFVLSTYATVFNIPSPLNASMKCSHLMADAAFKSISRN
jgi:hypothetical protein